MEEDVQYTSVVFNNRHTPQKANWEQDKTIYSVAGAMSNSATNAAPNNNNNNNTDESPESDQALFVLTAVNMCLWLLLLGAIAAITYLAISLTNHSAEKQRLSSENSLLRNSTELLTLESVRLRDQRAELQRLTERLNWTLQVIMSLRLFNVSQFCPQNPCRPCLDGWIPFESSCYLFYNKPNPWKTWEQSQSHCRSQNPITDLVTINSLQEQEFLYDRIDSYYDKYHGYWIGLSQQNDSWVWVDGRTDSLGFWMNATFGKLGPKALMIPNQTLTKSWNPAENAFQNKFICESKALTIG